MVVDTIEALVILVLAQFSQLPDLVPFDTAINSSA
jgi:hypothetical protein